jgi:hypothetical protein
MARIVSTLFWLVVCAGLAWILSGILSGMLHVDARPVTLWTWLAVSSLILPLALRRRI